MLGLINTIMAWFQLVFKLGPGSSEATASFNKKFLDTLEHRGPEGVVKIFKPLYSRYVRLLGIGSFGDSKDRRSFRFLPRELWEGGLKGDSGKARLVLTFLSSYRALTFPVKVDTSSITEISDEVSLVDYVKYLPSFWRRLGYRAGRSQKVPWPTR